MTRQEIYDRIRDLGSKDAFVLGEMKRLGFWNADQPTVESQLIEQQATLQRQLNELIDKQNRYNNRQAMLAEMRKSRMAAARQRREETKKRREELRKQRAEVWQKKKEADLTYLGEGVSKGLAGNTSDQTRLTQFGLPHFESPLALALAMELSLSELRFLAFHRPVSTVTHYKSFYLPKKSGGKRLISAPMPRLKKAQHWILEHLLQKITPTEQAHGFTTGRSIVSNAQPHVGQEVVVNVDLKDFFPTISFPRVKGLFIALGFAEQLATLLALLCTELPTDAVSLDGRTYFVATDERRLPQGAPTSPAISNLIAYRLDRRLQGMATLFGYAYTRYADDLTFSASDTAAKQVEQVLWSVKQIVDSEGFTVHPDKVSVMRKGGQQRVTGVVVNEKPSVDRATLRRFRALLHQISLTGWAGKSWGNAVADQQADLRNVVMGYANFVAMVKPEQGQALREQINKLVGGSGSTSSGNVPALEQSTPASELDASDTLLQTPPDANVSKDWWDVL
ncbi:reverse transcriptase domain-containing protein [uncultured Fibrella sp.]|uniref:reverse transcriptase domain-containing protein n=1 Tax=uncultured Fibrella sp. TaxID=1284596 RepID=UPI0035CC2048